MENIWNDKEAKALKRGELCDDCNSLCTKYIYECSQTKKKLCHDCALVSNVNGAGEMTGKYSFKSRKVQKKEIIWRCLECNETFALPVLEKKKCKSILDGHEYMATVHSCPHCGNDSSWKLEKILKKDVKKIGKL